MDELKLDFSTTKYDLEITPPLMNAAGTLGFTPRSTSMVNIDRLGAFITNPVSLYPRTPAKTRTSHPYPGGFLLHSGYPNPGLRAVIRKYHASWAQSPLPVIIHLLVSQVEDVQPMVANLEGRPGLSGIEIGVPPDCEPLQAIEILQAAVGELPLIVRVPMERASEFARVMADSPPAAISMAPPRGAVLGNLAQPVYGRLFGPAVFPHALAVARGVIDTGVPLIASGGVYEQRQVDAMLALGAIGVQLDSVLWSLEDFEGWQ